MDKYEYFVVEDNNKYFIHQQLKQSFGRTLSFRDIDKEFKTKGDAQEYILKELA